MWFMQIWEQFCHPLSFGFSVQRLHSVWSQSKWWQTKTTLAKRNNTDVLFMKTKASTLALTKHHEASLWDICIKIKLYCWLWHSSKDTKYTHVFIIPWAEWVLFSLVVRHVYYVKMAEQYNNSEDELRYNFFTFISFISF